jgi:hypothetical protein
MKTQRMRISVFILGVALALVGGLSAQALAAPAPGDPALSDSQPLRPSGDCPHDPEGGGPAGVTLDECYVTTNFIVYYTTAIADGTHRILNEGQAQWVADNLETARPLHE